VVAGRHPIGAVRDVPVGDLRGRLYTPTGDRADPTGLLVFFHGGGFMYGDLDSHDAPCRFLAERAGVRVLAVDYRLAPEHPFPAAFDDALAAYRWAVENAPTLGVDPDRIAVGGDSAGGNLAAGVALAAAREGLPLAFQLLVYPATDATRQTRSFELFGSGFYLTRRFMELANELYVPDEADRKDPHASPLFDDVPEGLAPAYVATAGFDPLRDEGEAYARKLCDAGVRVEMHRFPDQIHGFFNVLGPGHRSRAAVAEIAVKLGAALA
jgi:acetyl esterase